MAAVTVEYKFKPDADTERLLCVALLRTLNIEQTSKVLAEYLNLRNNADLVLKELKSNPKEL